VRWVETLHLLLEDQVVATVFENHCRQEKPGFSGRLGPHLRNTMTMRNGSLNSHAPGVIRARSVRLRTERAAPDGRSADGPAHPTKGTYGPRQRHRRTEDFFALAGPSADGAAHPTKGDVGRHQEPQRAGAMAQTMRNLRWPLA